MVHPNLTFTSAFPPETMPVILPDIVFLRSLERCKFLFPSIIFHFLVTMKITLLVPMFCWKMLNPI
jgi:hypothetical protein